MAPERAGGPKFRRDFLKNRHQDKFDQGHHCLQLHHRHREANGGTQSTVLDGFPLGLESCHLGSNRAGVYGCHSSAATAMIAQAIASRSPADICR